MHLKQGLVIMVLLSAVVFTGGVVVEHAAEPGASETVLGINPEAPGLVAAAIVLSILLAVAIALRPTSLVLAVAGAFGLIFAFVDTLEIADIEHFDTTFAPPWSSFPTESLPRGEETRA
jgi:hypothetical protein